MQYEEGPHDLSDITSNTLPVIKLMSKKPKPKVTAKSASLKPKRTKKVSLSKSRRDCTACQHDLTNNGIKANPNKFSWDFEKLKYFTNLYQQYALGGKVLLAEQCISRIKANHSVLSRLTVASTTYLVKNCQILFKLPNERVYKQGDRLDKAVLLLLYGRTKLMNGDKKMGPKMGIGYVFNEEAFFHPEGELARIRHFETLITTEECAFLRIKTSTFSDMSDVDSPRGRGTSPHLMEDQDLLWEFLERHYFVKSTLRIEQGLIDELPTLRSSQWEKRETLARRRRNSPSRRPVQIPKEAQNIIKTLKKRNPSRLKLL